MKKILVSGIWCLNYYQYAHGVTLQISEVRQRKRVVQQFITQIIANVPLEMHFSHISWWYLGDYYDKLLELYNLIKLARERKKAATTNFD
jgi:hypothetical protein